jgi:hypothetical protein
LSIAAKHFVKVNLTGSPQNKYTNCSTKIQATLPVNLSYRQEETKETT